MDIEGAEAAVLRGPRDWLRHVKCLKIEFHPPMVAEECVELLSEAGFTCRVDDQHDHCIVAFRGASSAVDTRQAEVSISGV